MSETTPEFSRRVPLSRLRETAERITVEADAAECAALAARFAIPAIAALQCRFVLRRDADGGIAASGSLEAVVTQICVVSLEPFETPIAEEFAVRFVPAAQISEEIGDLDDFDAPDEIGHDGAALDLGEAAAEQLALALDPWPRKPGAEMPVIEQAVDPRLAALARLKRPTND